MRFPRFLRRTPRPVVVFVSGEAQELEAGDSLDVHTADGTRFVLERSVVDGPGRTPILRAYAYARPNGLRAVKPKQKPKGIMR